MIVYGVNCSWWDEIEKAATSESDLPCCPKCGSVLFQTSYEAWTKGIETHNEKHPGYKEFMAWAQGKCFKKLPHAMSQWCIEMVGVK